MGFSIKKNIRNSFIISRGYLSLAMSKTPFSRRIIAFHDIPSKSLFNKKIRWLKQHFDIVSLEEILSEHRLTRDQVAITFDDGFSCWHEIAAPILYDLDVPATFFTCSGLCGESEEFQKEFIKTVLHRSRPLRGLSVEQLKDISNCRLFEIGGHTKNHVDLGSMNNIAKINDEIIGDQDKLSKWTGKPVRWFAYPYGKKINIGEVAVQVLKKSSYECAFSIIPGQVSLTSDSYCLPRDSLPLEGSNSLWRGWLSGGYDFPIK